MGLPWCDPVCAPEGADRTKTREFSAPSDEHTGPGPIVRVDPPPGEIRSTPQTGAMTTWTETIPVFAFFALLTFLPGWLVVRALGARGIASVAVSPIVTVTVLAVSTNLAHSSG